MLYGCGGCVVHASSASLLTEAFCTPPPPSPAPPYSLLLPLQFAVGQVDLHSALKHHRTSFSDPSEFTIVFTGKCYYFPLYIVDLFILLGVVYQSCVYMSVWSGVCFMCGHVCVYTHTHSRAPPLNLHGATTPSSCPSCRPPLGNVSLSVLLPLATTYLATLPERSGGGRRDCRSLTPLPFRFPAEPVV